MNGPRSEYSRRIEIRAAEIDQSDRTHHFASNLRLVLAAAFVAAGWQALVSHRISAIWPLLLFAAFAAVAMAHARVLRRIERARRAQQLYQRGLARIDAAWSGSGEDGARFLAPETFGRDLDLFGPGSLFQLLNTARTQIGEETLADWLQAGAEIDEVRARQEAVDELAAKLDFREELAVLAAESQVGRTSALRAWAESPPAGLTRAAGIAFAVFAAVSASIVALVAMETVPPSALLAWILAQAALTGWYRRRVASALAHIDAADHDLGLVTTLLRRIENEAFTAPRLAAVRARLLVEGVRPSRRIASLRRWVTLLDHATLNLWFKPIGALLMVRSQMAVAIDRWHRQHGPEIATWIQAVGEVEALSALGTYRFEHPADPFPELVEQGPLFQSVALGHPLIPEGSAVRNDVALGGPYPRALIVSGSNMSGKSTLLRAVGVNVVLALAGAPVRAGSVTMSLLAVGATIRVDDSLQAGHSRFYAEILRIRGIIDLARGARPLVFLLDEIFGGTNSHDRRVGAEAIVRVLVQAGAIGLVTTHDLALTELVAPLHPGVANVHFEDRIENGLMVFDYRMRPGVVEHSNALALMRAVGLEV